MDLNPEQLILGIAQGFDARTLEPFVLSLRRSGCRGRCRLFVAAPDKEAQAFLTTHGIEVEVFTSVYARFQQMARALHLPHQAARLFEFLTLRALEPLAIRGGAGALAAYGRLAPLHASALRYVLYHGLLTRPAGAGVKRVLLLDTRDAIFQRDPFVYPVPDGGLVGFFEESTSTLGSCETNREWVRVCYGEAEVQALAERGIYCSGATLGEAQAVLAYLRAMIREIARAGGWRYVPPHGFDQGCHNHLLHRAPPAPVTGLKNGAAPVVHLYHRKPEQLAFSPDGLLLNDDGEVVPVVHQWDRHPAAFAPALARLRGG